MPDLRSCSPRRAVAAASTGPTGSPTAICCSACCSCSARCYGSCSLRSRRQPRLTSSRRSCCPTDRDRRRRRARTSRSRVYRVKLPDGTTRELAELRRIGIMATMVDPAKPDGDVRVNIRDREPVREFRLATENYTELFGKFDFGTFLWNSVFITVVATLITLLFNSMAAFALSKYRFRGRKAVFLLILATLMIPPTIVLVPNFLVVVGARTAQQPVGRDLARGRDTDRRVPAAAIHADAARRAARSRAHGSCKRMAHLLADRAAAVRAGARGARHLLGDVALERLPVAAGRAVQVRKVHAAARAECVPGRAHDAMELPAGDDGADLAAGHARLRVPAEVHHARASRPPESNRHGHACNCGRS